MTEVVVVGGGLSGLTVARRLAAAGVEVQVLEARDRVGGKVRSERLGGQAVDFGAHWVGPTQTRVLALARELGVRTAPQHLTGRHVAILAGRRQTFRGDVPLSLRSLPGLLEYQVLTLRLERLSRTVALEDPAAAPDAARLDARTLGSYARPRLRSALARETLRLTWRLVLGAEPDQLSLLYVLFFLRSAGGLKALTDFEGGAQQDHFPGGSQQLCDALAERLTPRVRLGAPVTAIEQEDDAVVVRSPGETVRARHAIVALPPALSGRIAFAPRLSATRAGLVQRMPIGGYTKAIAVYDEPWWRRAGLSGLAYDLRGPVQMVADVSEGGRGALMGFVTGRAAYDWSSFDAEHRRTVALTHFARCLGPRAREPIAYAECAWNEDRWSEGAPVGLMGPGTLTGFGQALRRPHGRVHWAGTDTALTWNGYMDGAIEAGERAAEEILARRA